MTARGPNTVHPFFQKPSNQSKDEPSPHTPKGLATKGDGVSAELPTSEHIKAQPINDNPQSVFTVVKKKSKRNSGVIAKPEEDNVPQAIQPNIFSVFKPTTATIKALPPEAGTEGSKIAPIFVSSDDTKHKRRKLTSPTVPHDTADTHLTWQEQLQLAAGEDASVPDSACMMSEKEKKLDPGERSAGSVEMATEDKKEPHNAPIFAGRLVKKVSPKRGKTKVLKLNGAGGFETQIEKDSVVVEPVVDSTKTANGGGKKTQLVALVSYGIGDDKLRLETGHAIEKILATTVTMSAPFGKVATLIAAKVAFDSSKPTHPFFSGKPQPSSKPIKSMISETSANEGVDSSTRPNNVTVTATPGKFRSQMRWPAVPTSPEAIVSMESRTERAYKPPGTIDAPWPPSGLVRVQPDSYIKLNAVVKTSGYHKIRRKHRPAHIEPADDLLKHFEQTLKLGTHDLLEDGQERFHVSRQPERLTVSGAELKQKVVERLGVEEKTLAAKHPAFARLLATITTAQSSFDLGIRDNASWNQKHAPRSASEILQPDKEMAILRSWLVSQTVSSTEFNPFSKAQGNGAKGSLRSKDGMARRRRKRRKLSEELDDFIVDSDVDMSLLRNLSDDEDMLDSDAGSRSLVQDANSKDQTHKNNVVLVSGPHGCGKSAAVFAVAKELDFDVFEIGPNVRRSGKDILDRVGDMALNHQVSRANETLLRSTDTDGMDGEDAKVDFGEPSPDQATLTSFFTKAKVTARPKQSKIVKAVPKETPKPVPAPKQASKKKQSLILLEEVDILFEQDRSFWETVLQLALQSKRPIIMTCNDERFIPVDDLSLHALLRLRTPSTELASTYLFLVAASEGHLLKRQALELLYKSKKHDLRASMTELEFWCQMALGDPKGGMSWFLDRWPPGSDEDELGNKLRVVSVDTYDPSSQLPESTVTGSDKLVLLDEQIISHAWSERGIEPTAIYPYSWSSLESKDSCEATGLSETMKISRAVQELRNLETMTDLLSATDVSCRIGLPDTASQDPTQPLIPEKDLGNFMDSYPLLQSFASVDYERFDLQLAVTQHVGVSNYITSRSACVVHDPRVRLLEIASSNQPSACETRSKNLKSIAFSLGSLVDPVYVIGDSKAAVLDIAPYLRSIANFELLLDKHRAEMIAPGTKARMTRASRSALEGGVRAKTRRERWFGKEVDLKAVATTGGMDWPSPQDHTAISKGSQLVGLGSDRSRQSSIDELG